MEEEYYENQLRTINDKFENLEKQFEKGDKCVIIQLGSRMVKFGFANSTSQQSMYSVVTFRKPNTEQSSFEATLDKPTDFDGIAQKIHHDKAGMLTKPKKGKPSQKIQVPLIEDLIPYDQEGILQTNTAYFVGRLLKHPDFIPRFPLNKGNFNISPLYKEEQILNDILLIMEEIIFRALKIMPTKIKEYDLVLCLPDNFERKNYERLIDSIVKRFLFNGICLHYESVLACFANCTSVALWVDVGYSKTTLVCVEEGVQLPETLSVVDLGVKNIISFYCQYLEYKRGIKIDKYDSGELLEKLIYKFGNFIFDNGPNGEKPDELPKKFKAKLKNLETGEFEEILLNKDDILIALNSIFYEQESNGMVTLDKAVFDVLTKSTSDEMRVKYCTNMIVTGGLSELKGFVSEFEDRLIKRVVSEDSPIEEVAVIDMSSRGILKNEAVFQGGCILPKLDCFTEILINSNTYLGLFNNEDKAEKRSLIGKHYLKEKIPFQW